MKRKTIKSERKALSFTILYFLLFSFACTSTSNAVITAVPSSIVTYTPSLTHTPTPTETAQPSATFTPTLTPTPLVAGLGQVIFSESFEDTDFPFSICGKARTESGVLVVERGPEDPSPCGMFSGGIYGVQAIQPDMVAVVLFKTNSDFNIGVNVGLPTDEYHRFSFGITQGIATWDMAKGQNVTTWRTHATRVDSWYYFSIQRSANGHVDAKLWERANPKNVIEFHANLGSEWGTLPFFFVADFKDVPFFMDEYQVLK